MSSWLLGSMQIQRTEVYCLTSAIFQVEQLQFMKCFLDSHALCRSSCSCGSLRPSWCMMRFTCISMMLVFLWKSVILMACVQQASRSCSAELLHKLVFPCCIYPVGYSCRSLIPSTWALFESCPVFFNTSFQVVGITLNPAKQSLS